MRVLSCFRVAALCPALLLAACGGGGGGGAPANVAPVAQATATPASGIAALTVNFDGTGSSDSDGSIATWQWTFGDGGTGTGATPTHTYTVAGNYTATLTVTDDDGATHSDTVAVSVAANISPVAAFTATPSTGNAPLNVQFDATSSSDSDGSIATFAWDFGDGGTATGATPTHSYAAAGNYTATLTVTDDKGATHSTSRAITVNLAANVPPVPVLNADVLEGFAPLTVKFNGRASQDTDGSVTGWLWNFGKGGGSGNVAAIAEPTTVYSTPGVYTVQLTVTDNRGGTASTTATVYVADPAASFALAGGYSVPDTAFADCDVAGSGTTGCNAGFALAQPIQSPSTVGGYVSLTAADFYDDYTVSLAGGETLSLAIADGNATNDLELRVYESNGTVLIGQSSGSGTRSESLVISNPGDYMLRVNAVSGASNYVLSIGTATATAATPGEAFVEGEFIAHFSQLRIPWRIAAQREARAAELGMEVIEGDADTPMVLRERGLPRRVRHGLDEATRRQLQQLRQHPDVAWVELNRVRQPLLNATDTYFPNQWNLPLANFTGAWQADALRGNGTVVAVIDTGILPSHPDLAGRLVTGHDFVSELDNANDGNGLDADPTDPGGDGVGRSIFHGTHVAGIVAASTQFGGGSGNTGVAGAAPSSKVMPLRAVGIYGGLSTDIVQAIRYAAGLSNSSGTLPAQPADVINLSLGSTGYSQLEQDAITAARALGVIVVAAGGNSGTATPYYPAGYAGVIGVGAVTLDKRRAAYSNTGSHIDLVAPGGDNHADLDGNGFPDGILSTLANDSTGSLVYGYDFYQGSSMAAPHVSAVAALMKAVDNTLTPAVFDSLLASGALSRDLGAGGRDDEFGLGLIDAEKALVATGLVSATPAAPAASPSRIGLGASATQALVVVDNGGGGTLVVSNATSNAAWLTVTALSVDANGVGTYRLDASRASLANGSYNATVTFTTSAGNLAVPVNMLVAASVQTPGVGTLYLFAWDPVAQVAVAQQTLSGGTSAAFDLGSVAAGTYQVYAGTDNDNDGFICDPGEACGAWLSLQEPTRFAHVRDRTDLSFNVGYPGSLGTLSLDGATLPARGIPRR